MNSAVNGGTQTIPGFDCFLSHNSEDKPAVRELADRLRESGISAWLDEEQLRPGLPWQPQLEQGIRASPREAPWCWWAQVGWGHGKMRSNKPCSTWRYMISGR